MGKTREVNLRKMVKELCFKQKKENIENKGLWDKELVARVTRAKIPMGNVV